MWVISIASDEVVIKTIELQRLLVRKNNWQGSVIDKVVVSVSGQGCVAGKNSGMS